VIQKKNTSVTSIYCSAKDIDHISEELKLADLWPDDTPAIPRTQVSYSSESNVLLSSS
jgi:hypothetical protein